MKAVAYLRAGAPGGSRVLVELIPHPRRGDCWRFCRSNFLPA
jgi:hypothetical protein